MERLNQIRMAFEQTREADPRFLPILIGASLGGFLLAFGLAWFTSGNLIIGIAAGVLLGLLAGLSTLGRRAQRVQLRSIEGQPGAAYAVLQSMRGRWWVTPAVAFTRKQDLVHRVVGRPGVVLVGEGASARVRSLLEQEKRQVARAVGDAPIHEVRVGDGEGEVPLQRLSMHLAKLPRKLKPAQAAEVDKRLTALKPSGQGIPKGYIPRSPRAR